MSMKKSLLTISEPWDQSISIEGEILIQASRNDTLVFISKDGRKFMLSPRYKATSDNDLFKQGNLIVNIEEVDIETKVLKGFKATGSVKLL